VLVAAAHLVHLVLRNHRVGWNRKRASASSHRHSYLLGCEHICWEHCSPCV
jgi:hypothetical protein